MKTLRVVACGTLLIGAASPAAQAPEPLATLARMPVKEVTVFKDGHAFVLHEGRLPTDRAGNVLKFRNLLTLKLDWGSRKPSPTAQVGLVYLQKGLRWIPGYRVTLDGNGNAAIKLQTTLLNELADIDDVTANLVIGVPSFAFKDTMDPIALQQSVAQLSPYFQQGDRMQMLSNAIATQTGRIGQTGGAPSAPEAPSLGPETPESTKSEDLFVFTLRHVTMRKGERLVAAVAEHTIPYTDVFTLDLPFAPPPEVRANLTTEQEAEMARLFSAPKVAHKVRFTNKGSYPLTTAPALIVRDNRVLAQGLITYTAVNASSDLEITQAVDIQVVKSDAETARVPNAARWMDDEYARVDLAGTITLTNYRDTPVDIEVTRHVLGNVTGADLGYT